VKHTRIIVTRYGGPDALRVVEEECPDPKRGEVRVKVMAAGVSLPDVMMREGIHPETPKLPFTPGWDLVGEVTDSGMASREPNQGRSLRLYRSAARTPNSSVCPSEHWYRCHRVWILRRRSASS
jgi:NADPH:quinone reductase-like Zn-dependent oxidoreductase